MGRVLVVYYSRTGRTRRAVQALARMVDCDLDELTEVADRGGVRGYLSAAMAGMLGRKAVLKGERRDPSSYDLVVLATPVWSGAISPAMRTYLEQHATVLPEVAFLITCGGARSQAAVQQMRALSNRDPEAVAVLNDSNFERGALEQDLLDFTGKLETHLRLQVPLPVTPSDAAPPPMA
jgi:menaquinone-dependent protoporphyrinogen IX oxidase